MDLTVLTLPMLCANLIGIGILISKRNYPKRKKECLVSLGKSGAFVAREFIEKLDEDIDKYHFLAENIPCIIWSRDSNGRNRYYNHKWYEYTGLSWEESKNDGWKKIVHPSDLGQAEFLWNKSVKEGIPYKAKLRLLRNSDKTYRWHLSQSVPRRSLKGEIVQWIGSSVDVDIDHSN